MGSSYRVIGKIGGTTLIGSSKKLSMFLIRSPSPSPSTVCKMEEKIIADPIAEAGAVQPQYVVRRAGRGLTTMALVRTALLASCTVDRRYSTGFPYKRRRTRARGTLENHPPFCHQRRELCSSAGEF